MTLNPGAYLEVLTADSEAFAALAAANLHLQVRACPDWTIADLVSHLGGVYSWATAAVEGGGNRPDKERARPPTDESELMPWFAEWRRRVIEALSARRPEEVAWSFAGDATIGWWQRRQALETAVHLYDVQSAGGAPATIGPELAADGIDEFLYVLLPNHLRRNQALDLSGTLHLHATDAPGEWQVDFTGPDVVVRREHGKADTAVRGPAADLYLWLWNRVDPSYGGLEVFGDTEVLEEWRRVRP